MYVSGDRQEASAVGLIFQNQNAKKLYLIRGTQQLVKGRDCCWAGGVCLQGLFSIPLPLRTLVKLANRVVLQRDLAKPV